MKHAVAPRRLLSLVALALLGATACTGGGGTGSSPTGPGIAQDERTSLSKQMEAARTADPAKDKERVDDYNHKHQKAVADCMRQKGFAYEPFVPNVPGPVGSGLSPEQFTQQYGYGIATRIDAVEIASSQSGALPQADPNTAIRSRLSEQQKAAYDTAQGECFTLANKTIPLPPGNIRASGDSAKILDEVQKQVDNDPRVLEETKKWSGCVAGQGFTAASPKELQGEVERRAAPFREAYENARGALKDQNARNALKLKDVLSPQQEQELAAVQRFELTAAAADKRCGVNLAAVRDAVLKEKIEQNLGPK
ncbi:hypothetical protein [Kibdelosporangium aridum]|nr:hypothetical protein [Kibdelosporangium aridum]